MADHAGGQPLSDQQIAALTTAGFNLIAQAITIFDRDLRLAVCNRPFREMFNLPDHLMTPGTPFADTIRHLAETGDYGPIDDVEGFVRARVEQARTFEPHYMERTRANGRTISVEGSPLPEGGWVAVYTDISQTRQVEQMLRARSAELNDQVIARSEALAATNRKLAATITALEETKRQLTRIEARTRLTTEMMPAHIAHVDSAGNYTYSNRQLGTVMPGRPRQLIGRHISDALGPQAYQRIEPNLIRAYKGEASVFEFTDAESARRIRVAFTPDRNGGVYILSMDITEETQARAALQQSRRRAMAAQVTSGLAHDFSNLLTIIMGMQSRLARMDLPPGAAPLVGATQEAARRGGRLLNRVADMTGHRTLQPRPTDLQGLLADLKLMAEPALPQAMGLSVLNHTAPGLVMLDAGMLQDALLNLILNARDACGTSGQITVSAHVASGVWIEITVTDTGPGFSPAALEKGLAPFFTTKGGEGSGLGLPMAYDMAKLAGGDMRLSNTPTGACVTLLLPYRAAPPAPESGTLILLVEDNADLRADLRDTLVGMDHAVIEAASVDEAMALLADVPEIAFVLSDIQLEGGATGVDLARRLGASGPPCVLMTALPPENPLHAAALRHATVLRKPLTAADLTNLFRREAAE
ncbi:MAG: PAS-domain containing protein [Rhodobacteraceae bacterium]|nr:PAS-domain containing protein [Paracoccaceae bacterium]